MTQKRIVYLYRGPVERGSSAKGYRWSPGYSADGPGGGPLYPWMTERECREDAKRQGAVAALDHGTVEESA